MKFVSYAQNLEDLMLWRALKNVENGFYIDVGANDPTVDSVTRAFYERGWTGINIEPLKTHFDDLMALRPLDINLCIAAGNEPAEIEIWDFGVRGWGTADQEVIDNLSASGREGVSYKVPVTTLSLICAEYAANDIHFLKVDVEGLEKVVLQGMDFGKYRPWILVVEATKPNSKEESFEAWESLVLSQDYFFVYADGLNRFYVASEKKSLAGYFQYPPNVFDEFVFYSQVEVENALKNAEERLLLEAATADAARKEASRIKAEYDQIINSCTWRYAQALNSFLNVFRRRS
jgi:FkbM family methyltransferase